MSFLDGVRGALRGWRSFSKAETFSAWLNGQGASAGEMWWSDRGVDGGLGNE